MNSYREPWLPLELWSHILLFTDVQTIGRFACVSVYFRWIAYSDALWGPLYRAKLKGGKRAKITRVPRQIVHGVPFRTRYICLLYWFYDKELQRNASEYPLRLRMSRPRRLRALLQTTVIPPDLQSRPVHLPSPRVVVIPSLSAAF